MNTMINHFMLPPPPPAAEEVRYDLDDSDFRALDLTSAMGLVALAARWQEPKRTHA
jgi:hypothetical protein